MLTDIMALNIGTDFRHAVRLLKNAPGFTAAVVATLALGIGVNTTMFTALEAFVLRPLALPDADRIVWLQEATPRSGQTGALSYPDLLDWKTNAPAFESMAGLRIDTFNVKVGGTAATRVRGSRVSADFFRTMGTEPRLGRGFGAEQDDPAAPRVVVLSYGYWMSRFGSDPQVIGQTLIIDGLPHTIVGVGSKELTFPGDFANLWVPIAPLAAQSGRADRSMLAIGRLRPGMTVSEGRAQLEAVAQRLAASYPASNQGWSARVTPLAEQMSRGPRKALIILSTTVLFVLLICCANIANLLMARLLGREEEFAVRMAVGAGSGDLLRQLLTESMLLAILGGAAGLIVAAWGSAALERVVPVMLRPAGGFAINGHVLGYCAGLTTLTILMFGLLPARSVARRDFITMLRRSSPSVATGGRGWTARVLVAGELAVAVLLVNSAGLMIRWLHDAQLTDPGFRSEHVLTAEISTATEKFTTPARQADAVERIVEGLKNTAGVTAASAVNWPPMTNDTQMRLAVEGQNVAYTEQMAKASFRTVTPEYATVLAIPVLRGRFVSAKDDAGGEPVVVVNHKLAETLWPGENALGRRIATMDANGSLGAWSTVVGVVGDVRHDGPQAVPGPQMYFPFRQRPQSSMYLTIRTSGDPAALTHALEGVVKNLDPDLPVNLVRPMDAVIAAQVAPSRITAGMMALFSSLALLLAGVGLYGVMARVVAGRKHEFGIRMALGGNARHILSLVLRDASWLAVAGAGIGSVLALGAAKVLTSVFDGLRLDAAVFVLVAGILAGVTVLAASVPMRRVAKASPLSILRSE